MDLVAFVGSIDIYLFDQILRGRIPPGSAIFDAGCGQGRNLVYFLRAGYEVRAVDPDAGAIRAVRELARTLAPHLPGRTSGRSRSRRTAFRTGSRDFVISSAVLHFATGRRRTSARCSTARGGSSGPAASSSAGSPRRSEWKDAFAPLGDGRFRAARRQRALPRGRSGR